MRNPHDVLIKPVVTEKAMNLMEENKYTFFVHRDANKVEIKNAVQKEFDVEVDKVTTIKTHGKKRRQGRFVGMTQSRKKAIVKLKDGNKIELFESL